MAEYDTSQCVMAELAAQHRAVYDRQAHRFDQERPKILMEKAWLDRFLQGMPANAQVLDVGCGAGEPIAAYLIGQGVHVTGIDFSISMLEIIRARFPENTWHQMDMTALDLPVMFDGVIAWHSFFHLTPPMQEQTLAHFAAHLKPGGRLLLTVGDEEGECTGHVGGELVYHASLSYDGYVACLAAHGLKVLDFVIEDRACDGATVLLAEKGKA